MKQFRSFVALGLAAALLSGCMREVSSVREDSAKRVAMPVFMVSRNVPSGPFMLQAYERVYKKYAPATIYIEGDGRSYLSYERVNADPTPLDPIALRLAAQDGAPNVIYLARPGQYNIGWAHGKRVPAEYWTTKRFSSEVVDAYGAALDNIKAYHNVPSFRLVGYDGGAAIAAILASQRNDILSLQTVAGNLDPQTMVTTHNIHPLDGSLNPVDFAPKIATLPQRHFIGKLDKIVPASVYNSFAQSAGDGRCMNVTLVDNADHELGWAEQWKVLKDMPLDCSGPAQPVPVPFDPTPLDGDKYKAKSAK